MSAKMHKVLVGQIMCREFFFLQILMVRNFSLGPHSPVSDFSYETWKVVITQNLHELTWQPFGDHIIFFLKKNSYQHITRFLKKNVVGMKRFILGKNPKKGAI